MFRPTLCVLFILFTVAYSGFLPANDGGPEWRDKSHKIRSSEETSAVMTADGKFVVTGNTDGVLQRCGLSAKKFQSLAVPDAGIYSLAISRNGNLLASGARRSSIGSRAENVATVTVRESKTGKMIWSRAGHKSFIHALEFSPDDSLLVSACSDDTMLIWSSRTGKLRQRLEHKQIIYDVAFTADGKTLISVGSKGLLEFWNTNTWKKIDLKSGALGEISAIDVSEHGSTIDVSQDGEMVALAGYDNRIIILDWNSKMVKSAFSGTGASQSTGIRSVAFSPNGEVLLTGNTNGDVVLWDLASQKMIERVGKDDSAVHTVAFDRSAKRFFSAHVDGVLRIFESKSGQVIQTIEPRKTTQ